MEISRFRAMNTDITLAAEGERQAVNRGFAEARQFIAASEHRFTRFSEDSELSQLNRSAGSWFQASADMTTVVMLAKQYTEETDGLFNPAVLPNMEWIGYDRSMDFIQAQEAPPLFADRIAPHPHLLPLSDLVVDPEQNLIYMPHGIRLDLGGIAKGWIAEQAALLLAKYAKACLVDAGGDMFMVGHPAGEAFWQIELEDPQAPGWSLTQLDVTSGAVATSSTMKRKWVQSGIRRHHLIDPRTGEPAKTDWASVTVIAPHADTAEVFAKALLIAGAYDAEKIALNAPEISYLAVDHAGMIWGTLESLEAIHDN